jgi:hypothetical protein
MLMILTAHKKAYESPRFDHLLSTFEFVSTEALAHAKVDAVQAYFQPSEHGYLKRKSLDRVNKMAMSIRLVGPLVLSPDLVPQARLRQAVEAMQAMGAFASCKAREALIDVVQAARLDLDSHGARDCQLHYTSFAQAMELLESLARCSLHMQCVDNGDGSRSYIMDVCPQDVQNAIALLI